MLNPISRPEVSAVAIIAAVSVVLAGCGNSREPNAGGPSQGERTLRMAIGDPVSLDPLRASNRWAALVSKQICDTLVAFDPRTASLKAAIARSWVVAEDGRKVTFKLRRGIRFHDGSVVSAEDYVRSLSRFVQPKTGSSEHFLLRHVVGYEDVRAGRTDVLGGVQAVDDLTLELNLSKPYAELPATLAHPSAGAAVPKTALETSSTDRISKPLCSGPYRLARPWAAGQEIRLIRFSDYYGGNEAFSEGGRGLADAITLKPVDDAVGFQLFERQEVDVAPVPVNRLEGARSVANRLSSSPSGYMSYMGLPIRQAPYDNADFRKALAHSVDRGPILERLGQRPAASPTGFLPAGAGPVSRQDDCPKVLKLKADITSARGALAASNLRSAGRTLTVYSNSGGGHERWLEPLVEQWRAGLGIHVASGYAAWPQYLEDLISNEPRGPFRMAWTVKFPSPESVLTPLFESDSPDNLTGFSNSRFDDLLDRARRTPEDQARQDLYAQAARLLCEELPIIPIWNGENHYAFGHGWRAAGGRPLDRADVFGDPVLRQLSAG